jgi:2-polyprenyl-6-hydroxyphenyl methylase/3-demethylubiquinone-9 3-methyltransferase
VDIEVHLMDAAYQGFQSEQFDIVLCIQNGLSAFKIEPIRLIEETMRVTKKGGLCLFSSYSDKFWNDRLEWFVAQSETGLLGEIDYDETKDGVIVCKDGFRSSTYSKEDFQEFSLQLSLDSDIVEVDNSSLFWEVKK